MQPFTSILVQSLLKPALSCAVVRSLAYPHSPPCKVAKIVSLLKVVRPILRVRCLHAARCVPIACRRLRCVTMHERLRGCQHAGGQARMPYVCVLIALLAFAPLVVALPHPRPRPLQHATPFSRWTKSRSGCMAAQPCECACTRTPVRGCRSRLTA